MHISFKVGGIEYRAYDHLYAVSACGKVLRLFKPVDLTSHPMGYLVAGRRRLVHRMVATCWIAKPQNANHIHHKNHIKTDNRASNLEWVTPKEHFSKENHDSHGKHSMSEEGRQKLRNFRLGTTTSEETKQKQREASLRIGSKPPARPIGYKCSPEAIAKMSDNSPNATCCEVDGVVYRSFNEAGKALGIKPHTLRKRCLSTNFPTYKIV